MPKRAWSVKPMPTRQYGATSLLGATADTAYCSKCYRAVRSTRDTVSIICGLCVQLFYVLRPDELSKMKIPKPT